MESLFREYSVPMPRVGEKDMDIISTPIDFLGINYYTRQVVKLGNGLFGVEKLKPEGAYTDMGWEIYPQGLYDILTRIKEDYGDISIYITENGGETWQNVFDEASHVYGVTVDAKNPSTVFITTFEGSVYRSDNRGESWKRLGGYNFKWAKVPLPDPYNSEMLYITTFGSNVWYGPASGMEGAFEDIYPF
jgi:hypothetical protein